MVEHRHVQLDPQEQSRVQGLVRQATVREQETAQERPAPKHEPDRTFSPAYNPSQPEPEEQLWQRLGPFDDPYLDRFHQALMAGDSAAMDLIAIEFTRSPQGQQMVQLGDELYAQQLQEQQMQMQQQEQMQVQTQTQAPSLVRSR